MMGIVDQLIELLRLVVAAKDDLQEWMDAIDEDMSFDANAIEDTKSLIGEIESTLHEVGT
ncbi:hypothetical protein F4V43_01810 [Paenibacillus spiritus]|uniref:Uncharacterized protein n=1 Tax=Paenibacillus spiritus TaxID=2496557 RepID=A0A5J5GGM1_9BACL|nr:hypothetical protein [Paenibacillus spiritus]KAA9007247.1 hypothetical protein F4V43_01810 [Paenibacillus spiritus]